MKSFGVIALFFGVLFFASFFSFVGFVEGACPSGMLGYWRYDDNLNDVLGLHNGTIYDPTGWANIGYDNNSISGKSFDFDHGNGAFQVANSGVGSVFDFANKDFTIEFWLLSDDLTNTDGVIMGKEYCRWVTRTSSACDGRAWVFFKQSSGGVYVKINTNNHPRDNSWTDSSTIITDYIIDNGLWHHFVYQRKGSLLELYIDGVLRDTAPVSGNVYPSNIPVIAGQVYGNAFTNDLNGKVDLFAMYNRSLTTAEISSHYNSGQGKDYCDIVEICNNNLDDDGDGKIDCLDDDCDEDSACVVGTMSWRNMNKSSINNADLGDYVMMIVEDVSGSVGDEVKFSIYENDDSVLDPFDDDIRVGANAISGKVNVDGDAVAYWKITSADLAKTDGDYSEFYFTTDKSGADESSKLNILDNVVDDDLKVKVDSPKCGSDLEVGTSLQINVSVLDLDDFVSGKVFVEGEEIGEFEGNGEHSFDYDFDVAGNIQVKVDANNSRQVQRSSISNIMVYDLTDSGAKYIAACIDSPENYAEFGNSMIFFNASSTRALEIDNSVLKEIAKSDLFFKWVFSDGKSINSTSVGNYHGIIASDLYEGFNKRFGGAGKNFGTLTVSFI